MQFHPHPPLSAAGPEKACLPMREQGRESTRRKVLVAACLAAALLYFLAFRGIDSVYDANDRIASADSASFLALLQAPSIATSMGDEYQLPRTLEAQNQEHKIKHILVPLALRPVFAAGTALGASPETMIRAIGAALGGISIGLFLALLFRAGLPIALAAPLAVMAIFASSMFVYHGMMESWVLTGTLNLLLVLLHVKYPRNVALVPAVAGVAMLCNVTALFFCVLSPLRQWQQGSSLTRVTMSGLISVAIAAGTFLAGLSVLAMLVEPDLRIDSYVQLLRFFADYMVEPDTWTLTAAFDGATQFLLVSFVSLYPSLELGPAGIWLTKSYSLLGMTGLAVMAFFWVIAAWGLLQGLLRKSDDPDIQLAMRLLAVIAGTAMFLYAGHYRSMFLYASALIPCLLLVAGTALARAGRLAKPVAWVAATIVAVIAFVQLSLLRGLLTGASLS